jgi:hypothetical protein
MAVLLHLLVLSTEKLYRKIGSQVSLHDRETAYFNDELTAHESGA